MPGRYPAAAAAASDVNVTRFVPVIRAAFAQVGRWYTRVLRFPTTWVASPAGNRVWCRQSQGGIGAACDQRPRRAARASASSRASVASAGTYFRYH